MGPQWLGEANDTVANQTGRCVACRGGLGGNGHSTRTSPSPPMAATERAAPEGGHVRAVEEPLRCNPLSGVSSRVFRTRRVLGTALVHHPLCSSF